MSRLETIKNLYSCLPPALRAFLNPYPQFFLGLPAAAATVAKGSVSSLESIRSTKILQVLHKNSSRSLLSSCPFLVFFLIFFIKLVDLHPANFFGPKMFTTTIFLPRALLNLINPSIFFDQTLSE